MSTYTKMTKNPETGVWEDATWLYVLARDTK